MSSSKEHTDMQLNLCSSEPADYALVSIRSHWRRFAERQHYLILCGAESALANARISR